MKCDAKCVTYRTIKTKSMKLLVSGSRTATTKEDEKRLTAAIEKIQPAEIMTGGASGADQIAENWAKQKGIPTTTVKPDYKKYGKAATHIRNVQLIAMSDAVLCYYASETGQRSPGTASVAMKARRQNKLKAEIFRNEPASLF